MGSIASIAGHLGVAGLADYCGSKFAAVGIDEAVRFELQKSGKNVKTTCICPYFISTGMFDGAGLQFPFNLLLPVLTPEFVVDQTITAIRQNREMLIMPYFGSLIGLARAVLPVFVFDRVMSFMGLLDSMDHFD